MIFMAYKRIETITFAYNEEFLLPYYIKHYEFVDRINVFYDCDSNDRTLSILTEANCNVIHFKFPDMMNDRIKVDAINQFYRTVDCDVVLNVDVDEFVFAGRNTIEIQNCDVIKVKFANVYRHITESDLNLSKSVVSQRKHGYFDSLYHKPIIARTGLDLIWSVGNHRVNRHSTDCGILGSHWANADPCFCIERRTKNRKERQSQFNLQKKITTQHHHCTPESVLEECKSHENDDFVFDDLIKLL